MNSTTGDGGEHTGVADCPAEHGQAGETGAGHADSVDVEVGHAGVHRSMWDGTLP
jgi:hypothetical protein